MKYSLFYLLSSLSFYFYYLIEIIGFIVTKILFQFDVKGRERLKNLKGKAIFVINHCHYLDSLLTALSVFPKYVRFAGMLSHFQNPILKFLLPLLGAFPIRIDGKEDKFSFKFIKETLSKNGFIGFFPEYHMKLNSNFVGKFRIGAFMYSYYFKASIVPVAITINNLYLKKGVKLPLFKKIIIEILEPRLICDFPNSGLSGNEISFLELKKNSNSEFLKFLNDYAQNIRDEISKTVLLNSKEYIINLNPLNFIKGFFNR